MAVFRLEICCTLPSDEKYCHFVTIAVLVLKRGESHAFLHRNFDCDIRVFSFQASYFLRRRGSGHQCVLKAPQHEFGGTGKWPLALGKLRSASKREVKHDLVVIAPVYSVEQGCVGFGDPGVDFE